MADPFQLEIIRSNPIGQRLHAFDRSFRSACSKLGISVSADAVPQVVKNASSDLIFDLVIAFLALPASRLLPSPSSGISLDGELAALFTRLRSNQQDLQTVVPLMTKVVGKTPDLEIWGAVYELVKWSTPPRDWRPLTPPELPTPPPEWTPPRESTPPRKSTPPPVSAPPVSAPLESTPVSKSTPKLSGNPQISYPNQTPTVHKTASITNSAERREDFDKELKNELSSSLYIGVPGFAEAFFGGITDLQPISEAVFKKCRQGNDALYKEEAGGWHGWPRHADEDDVLKWFHKITKDLLYLAESQGSPRTRMRIVRKPNKPVHNSVSKRKLDIGFVHQSKEGDYDWSRILIPGELKSNSNEDTHQSTWLDLARYAREVFHAQDSRRFILGFTLCGSVMRLWEFDRLGGIASSPFDINKDGLSFVSMILGCLFMDDEQLGFDPTITPRGEIRYITITPEGKPERLVIDSVIRRNYSVTGRGTVCWKTHREGDESKQPLVVKDSWQYPERDQEGELLCESRREGVVNVARYYHHEMVRVGGEKDDTVANNIRNGLEISKATNVHKMIAQQKEEAKKEAKKREDLFRSLSRLSLASKDGNSAADVSSLSKAAAPSPLDYDFLQQDREHRRVVLLDYGKSIYNAGSRVALLAGLEGAIQGHQSLHKAGILHRDISINNVLVNEEGNSGFLIDLDLAIKEERLDRSGAPNKTGTKVFMAIGALFGEQHNCMHDLESFFWVLFWICIHYTGPNGTCREVEQYERWNYVPTEELANSKKGIVSNQRDFTRTTEEHFSPYFHPLRPYVHKLCDLVFPNGQRREQVNEQVYDKMRKVLRESMDDPEVRAK